MKRFLQIIGPVAVSIGLLVPFGAAHAATTSYVALGDSYSSGVGTNHYDLSSSCSRSSLAYPALVAAAAELARHVEWAIRHRPNQWFAFGKIWPKAR